MKIELTEGQVQANLGELRFIGAKPQFGFEDGKRTDVIETVTCNIGAPVVGGSIDIKLETNKVPNIKNYAVVKVVGLAYEPYATTTTFNGNTRAKMMDRFTGIEIVPVNANDRLADENGEKIEEKPKASK
ncbi:hypothetical protein IA525_03775 [Listeria seeligeri]|uniref:hypothetical protein n=1 Tax=Listeria seeligeri TaxID=1640 RepID=UPI001886CF37|nr:hypothetical protein [Listeria seeligeri]MBF2389850.1 hypothetical protein [Listeria seeligeri]